MFSAQGVLAAVALLGLVIVLCPIGKRPKNYPPGPPTIPILGNLHQLGDKDVHLQLEKWAREYGPVYSLIWGTKTMIVLTQDKAIRDLIDRRSAIYSDRPENYFSQVLCSGNRRFGFLRYGPTWRNDLENKQMLYDMITQPDQFLYNIRRYTNALTSSMVFGWRTPTYQDEKMQQLYDNFGEFVNIARTGAAAMTEYYPWLRKLPEFIFPAVRRARNLYQRERTLYMDHWQKAKDDLKKGTLNKCFCMDMAKAQETDDFEDEQASYVSGTLLEAGSDTTSNSLYAFIQAMLVFPDAQKKAQEELDRVVGPGRLPTIEDMPQLPYIRACTKETVRWMPTTILGAVPHAVTRDDYYEGYLIPKGAGVMINVWGIHMDPQRYPEPRRFNPDRYLGDDLSFVESAHSADYTKRDQFVFGSGRRMCPGMHVAQNSLLLAMSRLMWGFNIEPAVDPVTNKPIIPDPDKLTQAWACMPEEFPAKITPRSQAHKDLMIDEWKKAEKECLDPETKQWKNIPI